MKKIILLAILLVFLYPHSKPYYAFEKQRDGILIRLQSGSAENAKVIFVQVCTDKIIRIIASASDTLSRRENLVAVKSQWEEFQWTAEESKDSVEIVTGSLRVKINKINGAAAFYDKSGNRLLAEKQGGGKVFSAAEVLGEKTFHVRQLFDSSADEALFGLGAHQNGVWNYRGKDIDMWQYNIVDVNPFLISSKNFGILWNNYSRTKFGDTREYIPISSLKIYNSEGNIVGLKAEYFRDTGFDSLFASRSEERIEHKYTDVNDSYPPGFPDSIKSVRWSGSLECNEPGVHKFQLYSSGYAKVWLDGKLVVDNWRQNWLPWTHNFDLDMDRGKKYEIRIEWIHSGGFIGLDYLPPSEVKYDDMISLYSEVADQIDYYFVFGENIDEVISGYRKLTGKAPMAPKWAMGLWQSRERYKTQSELLDVVREFRERKIPLDNIVQDWFYWREDQWGSHEFDATRYPDPAGMIAELHNKLHANILISVWPKFYTGTDYYNEFLRYGWLYLRNVEKQQKDWVGSGYVSTFYDPYSIDARKLYWNQIKEKLAALGVDAWWLDSTEPDIQSNLSRDETILRMNPTAMGSGARYLNTYSLMNCRAVYEGQRETFPDKRIFILTRSAFAGQQRYGASTWSGDIAARWEDLKNQIPAGLNFSISGIPYWTTDIGGFAVEPRYEHPSEADLEEWRELNVRWFQFGTFCPLLRVHGQFPFREVFNIAPEDHPAYKAIVEYDKSRYRLMPYIYSLAGMVTHNDYTIMRALVMDFGYDKNVFDIGDQFMFGPALLINPVTEYKARSRKVYLPAGTGWYDLRDGKFYEGGQTISAPAPYSDIPLFVKAGAIIPCGPDIQYINEKPAEPVRIFIYAGADGAFSFYEDEGVNNNYENERFSWIRMKYDDSGGKFIIGARTGEFDGMLKERIFELCYLTGKTNKGFDFNSEPDYRVKYNGTEIEINLR